MSGSLRVGVIGGGNIACRLHLPAWQKTSGVEVVAVADPSPAARESARQLAGLSPDCAYADPLALIGTEIDIVDICTPPAVRSDLIIAAALAGKHVFAEKPLATSPAAARAAVDAASRAGIVFGVGHNYLVLDEVRAVGAVLASGVVGEVRTATVNYLGVEYVPGTAGDWRRDPAQSGGGVLMDMMHAIYLLEAFLGEPVERVSAFVDSRDPSDQVEDLALCRFETATKGGLVNVGWGLGNGQIDITGTLGRVSVQYQHGGTAPWAPLERVTVNTAAGSIDILGPEEPRPATYDEFPPISRTFPLMIEAFVDAVRSGGPPLTSGADGLRALEAAVGAYASAATGQVVHLPLDRDGPAFLRGTVGVPELPRPPWSPLERSALFTSEAASEHPSRR